MSKTRLAVGVLLMTRHIHEIPPEVERVVLLNKRRVLADGPKRTILSEQPMAELFSVPLRLLESGGFYQVVPG